MKASDIAAIILIASIGVISAYFVANIVLGSPSKDSVKVKKATPISAEVSQVDENIFNKDAINPTVELEIGGQ